MPPDAPTFINQMFEKGFVFGLLGLGILYLLRENSQIKNDIKNLQEERIKKSETESQELAILMTSCTEVLEEVKEVIRTFFSHYNQSVPPLRKPRKKDN